MKQQGFTLLEVLIAGLVITLGLVAVVTMQVGSQQRGFETHQKNLAGLYAQDLQARLNADTCYLSKEVNLKEEPPDLKKLKEFIDNDPLNKGLDAFIEKHKTEWRSKHFKDSRASWKTSLVEKFELGVTAASEKAKEIIDKGYWEFELTIKPTNAKKDEVKQSLIVRYEKDGC